MNSSSIDDEWWSENHSAIYITRTSSHFIIRNCTLVGEGRWDDDEVYVEPFFDIRGMGIKLESVVNGRIYNNTIAVTSKAIYGWHIRDCYISENEILGNPIPKTHMDYGVGGIYLEQYSSENNVTLNSIQNCSSAIRLVLSDINYILNNTAIFNSEGIVLGSNSTKNYFYFNNCSYNYFSGIALHFTWNNTVSYNKVCLNTRNGILITERAYNNTVSNNLVAGNGMLEDPWLVNPMSYMTLSQEYIGWGIYVEKQASDNMLSHNDVIENGKNAQNDVPGNHYDYNHWSDYSGNDLDEDGIGDTPYEIDGEFLASDQHPRMRAVYDFEFDFNAISTQTQTTQTNQTTAASIPLEIVIPLLLAISVVSVIALIRRRS